ncbi:MAG: outer membrane beta-barrel protein [Bradyrhizobium sp.]
MRSVKFFVAAGAASLLSSMASAADMAIAPPPMSYAPPPVADFGGWYLRGDIGFSNQSVNNLSINDPRLLAGVVPGTQTQSTGFDTGGIFGVGAGYQFNNWFRVDVTGQYRGKSNFKGTDLFQTFDVGGPAPEVDNYNASKSELLFLANAYVDLGTWWCVTPFIGAGIGTSRVTISNFTDAGNIPLGFPNGGPSFATAATGSKWNFAWAAHAGLAYKVTPNMTVELAYSYVNLGDGVTGGSAALGGPQTPFVFNFHNITSNDLTLGVRWNLWSPPAYAPPLVTKG